MEDVNSNEDLITDYLAHNDEEVDFEEDPSTSPSEEDDYSEDDKYRSNNKPPPLPPAPCIEEVTTKQSVRTCRTYKQFCHEGRTQIEKYDPQCKIPTSQTSTAKSRPNPSTNQEHIRANYRI